MPWLLFAVARARAAAGRPDLFRAGGLALISSALLVLGGEPALAALALLLAFALALRGPAAERGRGLLALFGGGLGAALLVSPWLLEVARASSFSARLSRGFSWTEFAAVGFHPLRLLETPFPLLFGDPTRIVSGAFWGFAATQGNPPYHASLSFGVVPFALAAVFVVSARRSEGRFWIGVAAVALAASVRAVAPGHARPVRGRARRPRAALSRQGAPPVHARASRSSRRAARTGSSSRARCRASGGAPRAFSSRSAA